MVLSSHQLAEIFEPLKCCRACARAWVALRCNVLWLGRSGEHFNGTFTATLMQTAVAGIPQSAMDDEHLGEVHSRAETRFHETVRNRLPTVCEKRYYK